MKASEIFETPEAAGFNRVIKEFKPNPGSKEARDQGCTCPIIDNGYGKGCGGEFVIRLDCPLHTLEVEELQEMIGISNPQAVQKDK